MEPGFFPLDEELELLPGSLSPTLHNAVVLLGATMPFRRVPPVLALLGRVGIGYATACRVTEQAGAALVALEEATVADLERTCLLSPTGPARLHVSVDGAMVPLRGGEWKEAKRAAVGIPSATNHGKTEQLSYVSRLQEADRFGWVATGELHRRGTFAAEQVVAVVDGALWCQSFLDYHVPDAVRILDFPHAVENLNEAGQACFGQGSKGASEWLRVQRHSLRQDNPQTVIDAVAALPVDRAVDPQQAATVRDRVHAYLRTRVAQMAYATFAAQGFPIGSGSVESANKLVVEARLKGPGMHWKKDHVDPMLSLRCAICSRRWEEVWPQISRRRRHTARRSTPRPAISVPLPPPTLPLSMPAPNLPSPTPRPRMFENGKPTLNHPWKRRYLPTRQDPAMSIPKN